MAETLGSLVDKLTIKAIRLETLKVAGKKVKNVKEKIKTVDTQRKDLVDEIDGFLSAAVKGQVKLKELKVKLYNKPLKKVATEKLGSLIERLAFKNMEIWNLEDEVRRTDIGNARVVKAKRKIDIANQERNDLMDNIDSCLERKIKRGTGRKK